MTSLHRQYPTRSWRKMMVNPHKIKIPWSNSSAGSRTGTSDHIQNGDDQDLSEVAQRQVPSKKRAHSPGPTTARKAVKTAHLADSTGDVSSYGFLIRLMKGSA